MKISSNENQTIRILLAEDDEDDRLFFRDAIKELKLNTSITMVRDGEKLMKHLLNPDNTHPHILFLDLNMPKKSGIECLTEIRNHPLLKDLSIAIYSTSLSNDDIEETFVRGANIYINKPNDFNVLKSVLKKVISTNWQFLNSNFNKETYFMNI